jgi:hypothetical protein
MALCRKLEKHLVEDYLITIRTKTWDAGIAEEPPSVQYGDLRENGLGALLLNIVGSLTSYKSTVLLPLAANVRLLLRGRHRCDT